MHLNYKRLILSGILLLLVYFVSLFFCLSKVKIEVQKYPNDYKLLDDNKYENVVNEEITEKIEDKNENEIHENINDNEEIENTETNNNEVVRDEEIISSDNVTNEQDNINNNNNDDNKTIENVVDKVDALRKTMESTYGINIKYGDEIGVYQPKGLTPTKMNDADTIYAYLEKMEEQLKRYPDGFFKEFDGMPLTVFLVDSVPNNAFSGYTDREFMNDIKITLVSSGLFEYTFNHEIMHYIDAYLEIKLYPNSPYLEYEALNPAGFVYGNVNSMYNYGYNSQFKGAYFINDYSQYSVLEDRAEVFKMMITRVYKPYVMFDEGEIIYQKALLIDKQIRESFKSATGTLYWDKLLH